VRCWSLEVSSNTPVPTHLTRTLKDPEWVIVRIPCAQPSNSAQLPFAAYRRRAEEDRATSGGREACELVLASGARRRRMTAALSEYDPGGPARAEQRLAAIQERLSGVTGTSAA
jgi:hypothetical protein